jgi:sodium-coupled neutral amino acid transporter 11
MGVRTLTITLFCVGVPTLVAFAPERLMSSSKAVRTPALTTSAPALVVAPRHSPALAPMMTAAAAEDTSGDSAGSSDAIFNLAKNIVGSGVLALSAGVAAFSASPLALAPSIAILLAVGGVSAYTFSTIARVGAATGGKTYRDTWMRVFGKSTTWMTDATVIFMTVCAGLSYSIILGDMFSSIAALAGLPAVLCTSNAWIILLSFFVLLPLSLLRDLSSLAAGSLLGTIGTSYTALFVLLRCFDKSYLPGGKFHALASHSPNFAAASAAQPLINPSIFVLVSMLASAFLAHYNAPKFYNELEAPKDGSSMLKRFNGIVGGAFGLAALLMGVIMGGGYMTFGSASQGLLLNNYATADPLAFLARVGIGVSIIFSYPLNFVGLREGLLEFLGKTEDGKKRAVHWGVTLSLMALMNGASLFLKDLGLVVALGGAILGSALVYIFPALMAIGEKSGAIKSKGEKLVNWALLALGVFFAGLGSVMCLK